MITILRLRPSSFKRDKFLSCSAYGENHFHSDFVKLGFTILNFLWQKHGRLIFVALLCPILTYFLLNRSFHEAEIDGV